MASYEHERHNLHSRLLDAVRSCQTHLGGKKELVTESSSWVSCLCTQLEAVLQHRMKTSVQGLSAIKQVTGGMFAEDNVFWNFVKNHLTKHEVERFEFLPNIATDVGRGRAWLRCSLNEHSLERYFHMLLSDVVLLRNFYENEAFMLDEEKSSTLPQMAAGLGSIYFKVKFDDVSLDASTNKPQSSFASGFIPNLLSAASNNLVRTERDSANSTIEAQCNDQVKKKPGRKKKAKIISFGDDDIYEGSITPAQRGGPGFVVVNPHLTFPKSNSSMTSDSSSGVFSNESGTNNKENNKYDTSTRHAKENSRNVTDKTKTLSSNISHSYGVENLSEQLPLSTETSEESSKLALSTSNVDSKGYKVEYESFQQVYDVSNSFDQSMNPFTIPDESKSSANAVCIPSNSQETSDAVHKAEDLGQVTQHLMSVRHNSALESHDLVMDDWSVRSSSVSGLHLPNGNISAELYPVEDDDDHQSSDTKSDVLNYADIETSSSLALSLAKKSSSNAWQKVHPGIDILDNMDKNDMSTNELQQALVALMQRKNEIVDANKSMRSLLDSEMEHSASLRLEIENLQTMLKQQNEQSTSLQQKHIRENEVLRNQLKKYVGAVQALQRGDTAVELPMEPSRGNKSEQQSNYEESEVYEKKLIEVAEMHGELMEFNERLHMRLQSAISLLNSMKAELVDLRGPMPNDDLIKRIENDDLSGSADSSPPPSRALINIWMPSAFLKGKGPDAHHVYQVYIRIADEEWNVYRRYSHFHELHLQLRKKFPILDTYGFPPKKVMGNKGKKFVEYRRKALQSYLRLIMNNIIQNHEKLVASPVKSTLLTLLPFFSESMHAEEGKKKKQGRGVAIRRQ